MKAVTERHTACCSGAARDWALLDEKEFPAELTAKLISGRCSRSPHRLDRLPEDLRQLWAKAAIKRKNSYLSLREVMDPDNEGRRGQPYARPLPKRVGYTDKATGGAEILKASMTTTCWKR